MPKISIIVPVYNSEKYLERCLVSIRDQKFEGFECLIIDDGSKDGSASICDKFASLDSRFIVRHTENQGVSAARNLGLSMAKGDYIGFVDSDDRIDENMFVQLYNDAISSESDIVICGAFDINKGKHNEFLTGKEANLIMFNPNEIMRGYSWTRIIKHCLLESIRYDENIRCFEDLVFFYHLFNKCNKVYWHDTPLYYYANNPGSLVYSYRLNDVKKIGRKALKELAQKCDDSEIKQAINCFLYVSSLERAIEYVSHGNVKDKDFEQLKEEIKEKKYSEQCTLRQKIWRHIILHDWMKKVYWAIKGVAKD